jgi:regulator of replication initiation timing
MTSAITIAKDAKSANEKEIQDLREKNRNLEEENARLKVEVTQLRRDRRGSPILKDEPTSPKLQFESERRLSASILGKFITICC